MNPEKNTIDKEFEQYLQGKSALSQEYADLPEVQLPDHLDAAIMAEAHRAVDSKPGGIKKRRWTAPLSMVATLFVVVMAGLLLPDLLKDMQRQQEYAGVPKSATAKAPEPPMIPEEKRLQKNILQARENEVVNQQSRSADHRKKESVAENEVRRSVQSPVPVATRADNSPSPSPSPLTEHTSGLVSGDRTQYQGSLVKEKSVSPAMLSGQPEAGKVTVPESTQMEKTRRVESAEQVSVMKRAEKPVLSTSEKTDAVTIGDQRGLAVQKDDEARLKPAKEWLKQIMDLKTSGQLKEFHRELDAFRKKYPDYPLPHEIEN